MRSGSTENVEGDARRTYSCFFSLSHVFDTDNLLAERNLVSLAANPEDLLPQPELLLLSGDAGLLVLLKPLYHGS